MNSSLLYIQLLILLDNEEFQRFKQGDQNIIRLLYNEYVDRIYAFLRKKAYKLQDDDIKEIIQNTFIKILKKSYTVYDPKKLSSWILSISHNEYCNFINALHKNINLMNRLKDNLDPYSFENNEDDELAMRLKIVLNNLKPIYKQVIIYKYLENKSQKEISQILNKSEGAIEQLLQRAKKQLIKLSAKEKSNYKDIIK